MNFSICQARIVCLVNGKVEKNAPQLHCHSLFKQTLKTQEPFLQVTPDLSVRADEGADDKQGDTGKEQDGGKNAAQGNPGGTASSSKVVAVASPAGASAGITLRGIGRRAGR